MAKLNGVYSPTDSIKGFIPQIKKCDKEPCLGCESYMPADNYCIKKRKKV